MRSGSVHINDGLLWNIGISCTIWPATGVNLTSSTMAKSYAFEILDTVVRPSGGPANRWNGFPLRCLTSLLVPLYYVRSGFVYVSAGCLWAAGSENHAWSSTTSVLASSPTARAYLLSLMASEVNPSNGTANRWTAVPLRCQNQTYLLDPSTTCAVGIFVLVPAV